MLWLEATCTGFHRPHRLGHGPRQSQPGVGVRWGPTSGGGPLQMEMRGVGPEGWRVGPARGAVGAQQACPDPYPRPSSAPGTHTGLPLWQPGPTGRGLTGCAAVQGLTGCAGTHWLCRDSLAVQVLTGCAAVQVAVDAPLLGQDERGVAHVVAQEVPTARHAGKGSM